jgi:carbamoyl-phosphate synthase small subunit
VKPGLLVTADGAVFRGRSVGAGGVATGEVVFNTAMAGYHEVMTDPSYAGQIVTMTAPHIGNYGVNSADEQADRPHAVAVVTRSLSRMASSWRAEGGFDSYLAEHGLVVLTDVDTRRLTRHVRDHGAMPAAVGSDADVADLMALAATAPAMRGRDLVSGVTTARAYRVEPSGPTRGHIVAYDFGIKRDLVGAVTRRGVAVTVVPAGTTASDTLSLDPDAVLLSNGPGDPDAVPGAVGEVRALLGRVPVFGVCLGHQILGLALGATTFKLPFGHHGGNHPVQRRADGRIEITAQNHGFAVDLWSLTDEEPPARTGLVGAALLPGRVETGFGTVVVTHQNLNDGTLEGLACPDADAASVQYHPEAAPGPNDAAVLLDRFVEAVTRAA